MDPKKLEELVVSVLKDMKAEAITQIDVREQTTVTDVMIVCSGSSSRHTRSIADRLINSLTQAGKKPLGVEGMDPGEWILIDISDVVVHVMLPETREFYSIEKLWQATEERRQLQ